MKKRNTSNIFYYLMLFSIVSYLTLSPALLNEYYFYAKPGGSLVEKFHVGTYFIIFLFIIIIYKRGIFEFFFQNMNRKIWILQFSLILIIISIINVVRFGPSGAAYMVDTLLVSSLSLLILNYVSSKQRYQLSKIIITIVFFNSIVAIFEFLLKTHFMPHGQYMGFAYFRSSAFFGHPLANALLTAPMLALVMQTNWALSRKLFIAGSFVVAILAFGARGGLMIGLLTFAIGIIFAGYLLLLRKEMALANLMPVPWVAFLGLLIVTVLLFATDFGARIIERGLTDDSAESRITSFNILSYLSSEQIWNGIDFSHYQLLLEKYPDLNIIENFWINLLVSFGIPLFVIFVISFLWFIYGLQKNQSILIKLSVLCFLLVASTNNSLSTKTSALTIFSITIYGFRSHVVKNSSIRENNIILRRFRVKNA